MKVQFDATPIIQEKMSGVGYFTKELLESFIKYYPETNLTGFYFNFLGRKKIVSRIPGIKLTTNYLLVGKIVNMLRRIGINIPVEIISLSRSDVILFPHFISRPSIFNIPIVSVVYDTAYIDIPESLQSLARSDLTRFMDKTVGRSTVIITNSKFTRRRLEEIYKVPRSKIIVDPIPPPEPLNPSVGQELSLLNKFDLKKNEYLLFLGNIEPRKNLSTLLDAYINLPDNFRNKYALVIAGGEGWKSEELNKKIEDYIKSGERIVKCGYVSELDRSVLYKNCFLYIQPSHYEGFGMPILESMSYCAPVIASDIEVFHEVGGNAVRYFNKDSSDSLANLILEIINNKSIRKQLIKASQKNLERFSWKDTAKLVHEAIVGAANRKES